MILEYKKFNVFYKASFFPLIFWFTDVSDNRAKHLFFPARQLLNEASCWLHVISAFLHVVVRILKEKQTLVSVVIPVVTPLYGPYKYVRSQRVWFFIRFGHK